MASAHRSLARWATSVRAWPLWELPNWLVVFIVLVVSAYAAAIGFAMSSLTIRPHDLVIFGTLLACSAATVELRHRKADDSAGVNNDVYGVWELAIAILLPPAYVLVAPIVRFALIQWRVRRSPAYRRFYTTSSIGLSFGAASVVFHLLDGPISGIAPGTALHGLAWLAAVLASGIVKTALNKVLIMTAIKGSDPSDSGDAEKSSGASPCTTSWLNCVSGPCSRSALPPGTSSWRRWPFPYWCCSSAPSATPSCSTTRVLIRRRGCSTPGPGNGRQLLRSPGRSGPG